MKREAKRGGLSFSLAIVLSAAVAHAQEDDLARARFLDQQGVRAFAENRFRDAMTLFSESLRAGGPPTELWNLARCQLKVEDFEAARRTLQTYLESTTLGAEDRAEGKRLLDEILHKSSLFVVASTPAGATVTVDGHAIGVTPFASSLPPGSHDVKITRNDAGNATRHVEAHDGHPVVISVDLASTGRATSEEPTQKHPRRFSAELGALGGVSWLGGNAVFEGTGVVQAHVGFAPFVSHDLRGGFGLRVAVTGDRWSTSANVSNVPVGLCTPPNDYSSVEVLATPTVFGAYRVSRRVSLGARVGFGAAIYATSAPIGGDLFMPSCVYGGSLAFDGYASLDVSLRLTDDFRFVVIPASLDVHSGYGNTRNDATFDATGAWFRLSTGLALALDL